MNKNSDAKLFRSAEQMSLADNYNDWTFSFFQNFVQGDVLEIGCGVGSFSKRIIQKGGFETFLGIDISKDAIRFCNDNYFKQRVKFKCVDVDKITGKYDLIICMNVLEHIENDEKTLKTILRSLKKNGTLFLLVPAHQALYNRFDIEAGHFRRYSKKTMHKLLNRSSKNKKIRFRIFYFNLIGALGYWFVYRVLNKYPKSSAVSQIGIFDKAIVPISRRFEGERIPFGISLVAIVNAE